MIAKIKNENEINTDRGHSSFLYPDKLKFTEDHGIWQIEGGNTNDRIYLKQGTGEQIDAYLNSRYQGSVDKSQIDKIVVIGNTKRVGVETDASINKQIEVHRGGVQEVVVTGANVKTAVTNMKLNKTDNAYKRETLPANFGEKKGDDINKKLASLEADLKKRYKEATVAYEATRNIKEKNRYLDIMNATQGDLSDLRSNRNKGSSDSKVELYNSISYELSLELKYNVNLTSKGKPWSCKDLQDLDDTLKLIKNDKLTTGSTRFNTISLEELAPGVGGYNNGMGVIKLAPGKIKWALIHEIGHNFDDENPQWKEFQKISGWTDVSQQFSQISADYDRGGAYIPYKGRADLKRSGKALQDGNSVDLDGDGDKEGVLQVQYGKALVYNEGAEFVSRYASTSPHEDFAETFSAFFQNPSQLKKQCPEKFQFMINYVGYDPTVVSYKPAIRA